MAITVVGVNNAAGQNAGTTTTAGTAAITPTLPAGTASGDRVFVIQCASNTSGTTPTGWTVLGSKDAAVGTGTVAASAGQRYMTVYYRDYNGSWSMPSFTLTSATNNSHWIGAVSVRPTIDYGLEAPTVSTIGSDFGTANTAHSAVTGSITTHSNGMVIVGSCQNDNVTSTGGTLTQTGATFGTVTERADGGTATGNDVSGTVHTAPVTTGATGAVTFAKTLSAASEGGSIVVEQTEAALPAATTPTFRNAGAEVIVAGTALNVPVPAGVAADDIILVVMSLDTATVPTPPAGFTQASNSGANAAGIYQRVFWKRATGADSGTYNFTATGAANPTAVALRFAGCISSGTPLEATTSASNTSASTSTPAVSATTTGPDRLWVWNGQGNANTTYSTLSGFTEVHENGATGFHGAVDVKTVPSASSSGSLVSTMGTSATSLAWLGALLPPVSATNTGAFFVMF